MKSTRSGGWFKESHRHYLAAKGIQTRKYNSNKVGVGSSAFGGGALMDGAFNLGKDRYSIADAYSKGNEVMPSAEHRGESILPGSFEFGKEWTPDPMNSGDILTKAFEGGSSREGHAVEEFQAHKHHMHSEESPAEHAAEKYMEEEHKKEYDSAKNTTTFLASQEDEGVSSIDENYSHKHGPQAWTEKMGEESTGAGVHFVDRKVRSYKRNG